MIFHSDFDSCHSISLTDIKAPPRRVRRFRDCQFVFPPDVSSLETFHVTSAVVDEKSDFPNRAQPAPPMRSPSRSPDSRAENSEETGRDVVCGCLCTCVPPGGLLDGLPCEIYVSACATDRTDWKIHEKQHAARPGDVNVEFLLLRLLMGCFVWVLLVFRGLRVNPLTSRWPYGQLTTFAHLSRGNKRLFQERFGEIVASGFFFRYL